MRRGLLIILVIALSSALPACVSSEFSREDLGLAAHLGMPVKRVLPRLARVLPGLPEKAFSLMGPSASVSSKDDGFSVSFSDLNGDGKVDLIILSSHLYARSEHALGREAISERFRTTFTEEGFTRFVGSFTAKYPGIRTARGLTLGATREKVRETYGPVPQVTKQEGVKELSGYRQGGDYLLFVIFSGRVVRIALLRRIYDMDYHLQSIF